MSDRPNPFAATSRLGLAWQVLEECRACYREVAQAASIPNQEIQELSTFLYHQQRRPWPMDPAERDATIARIAQLEAERERLQAACVLPLQMRRHAETTLTQLYEDYIRATYELEAEQARYGPREYIAQLQATVDRLSKPRADQDGAPVPNEHAA